MWSLVPIIGWLFAAVLATFSAVPFWFLWTYCELGKLYFTFLPAQFHSLPFWDITGLFLIATIIKFWMLPIFHNRTLNKKGS